MSTWHSYLWTLHAHASSFLHLTCMCHLMWHSSECMLYDASTICLSNMHVSFFHVHGLYLLVSSVCLCWLLLWWHSDFIHLTSLSSKFYSWMLHPQSSFISQRIVLCAGIWPFDGPLLKRVGNSRCFQIKRLVPGRSVYPGRSDPCDNETLWQPV